ncbi:MAG: DUF885 domain-containing protein [Lachnospiraceae bacterium]
MSKKRSALTALLFLFILFLTACHLKDSVSKENQLFETYTETLFCEEVKSNSISLHYTLKNPDSYGIESPPVSLGTCTTDTTAICASIENAQSVLSTFHPDRLSKENRLTYDILKDYYDFELKLAPYALYEEPLSPLTGTQSQLPVILSEYQFYNTSDIDTYLELLTKVPAYFDAILEFEKARADLGIFMSEESLDALLDECDTFVKMGKSNYLYSSFEERINELDNSQSLDRENYKKINTDYIKKYIFPAYKHLADGLEALREYTAERKGLASLPGGKDYYKLLVKRETGSDRSIEELQELTRRQMMEDLGDMQTALIKSGYPDNSNETSDTEDQNSAEDSSDSPTSDIYSAQGIILEDSNPMSILTLLQSKMEHTFPASPSVDVQIKYVSKSLEEYLSPAFYMIPAIDNVKSNVIYINSGQMSDDLSLFTTLAHEGYPGHLYQNVYYMSQDPDPVRCLLDFGGYAEGWATYSEMLSYYYAPIPKETATIMQKNTSIILGIYALADMGIHYDSWSLSETLQFFQEYGINDAETVKSIYELILQDPANYLKYYIGYLEFLELKKDAIKEWGDEFTQKKFHKAVLDVGPAPFWILGEQLRAGN